ncbi:MAG: hypothetical protein A3H96_05650 [Acidobacteria bacterium RIFCSPLOWO2_02_FULL_67_36]|nr:MAG: hypothetical protein A3H96_05650 [Acidobacteria bacterium RIFCSPLOWO2_02_FULL_67_36]OFW19739.1 MAG: hypothetical protein A3G21_13230 [Acidobacteria bacterium RIFCSPLOWO2_12_FULL_66_21]
MSDRPQTFENHARIVPLFHIVALPILALNFLWSLYRVVTRFGMDSVVALLVAFALIVVALFARVFALTAQDRVIRLEMRLRMRELLPADLQPRIGEFTVAQLVSLRFAADDELPALARRVLEERLTDRKAIKRLVRDWQADNLRV